MKILTESERHDKSCVFEIWNKDRKQMDNCYKTPIASYNDGYICVEHVADVLNCDSEESCFDSTGYEVLPFKFMEICKNEESRFNSSKS